MLVFAAESEVIEAGFWACTSPFSKVGSADTNQYELVRLQELRTLQALNTMQAGMSVFS
jgi:hypothetical protein